jgi:hypothetical protein
MPCRAGQVGNPEPAQLLAYSAAGVSVQRLKTVATDGRPGVPFLAFVSTDREDAHGQDGSGLASQDLGARTSPV